MPIAYFPGGGTSKSTTCKQQTS